MRLLAVGTADWGVRAGVPDFAVANRTGVFAGGVVLAADGTNVAVVGAALGGVPILLALIGWRDQRIYIRRGCICG